jgi:hypothetical protein
MWTTLAKTKLIEFVVKHGAVLERRWLISLFVIIGDCSH